MGSFHSPNSTAPFIFSALASGTIPRADADVERSLGTFNTLEPLPSQQQHFNLGFGGSETRNRNEGRSHGNNGRRAVSSHLRFSQANGLKAMSAAFRYGAASGPTPLATAGPPPPSLPDPEHGRNSCTGMPLRSLSCEPPLVSSRYSVTSADPGTELSAATGSRRLMGCSDSLPLQPASEDSGANALDQLISLLLLPDDDVDGRGHQQALNGANPLSWPSASGNAATVSNGVRGSDARAPCLPEECDTAAEDTGAAGNEAKSSETARGVHEERQAPPVEIRDRSGDAAGTCGQPDSGSDNSGDLPSGSQRPADDVRAAGPSCGEEGGDTADGALGLDALAEALDEVDASLDFGLDLGLDLHDVKPPSRLLPPLAGSDLARQLHGNQDDGDDDGQQREGNPLCGLLGQGRGQTEKQGIQPQVQQLQHIRRPRRVAKRTGGSWGAADFRRQQQGGTATQAGARGVDTGCWKVMLAAPVPHNPENLATLLLAGRLVNPHTAVPAPLLAAVAREHQQQQQQQQGTNRGTGGERPLPQQQREPMADAVICATGQGPAVALLRCASKHDAAAALALNGRRLYSPPPARNGADSWRPITVVLQSSPEGTSEPGLGAVSPPPTAPPLPPQAPRVREAGPRTRRVALWGLPGHLDGDDVIALFGNGLQLPGHCPTPQDRRFLVLCPDAASFSALMDWSGARLPDKPLDALQQIVPRVTCWTTLHVEEDDGVQLAALMSQLTLSARLSSSTATAAAAASRRQQQQQQQQQQQWPRVAGRFHPAELDEMDETAAAGAEAAATPAEAATAARQRWLPSAVGHRPSAAAGPAGALPPGAWEHGLEKRVGALSLDAAADDAAAAAERAESSRGASSSGVAVRPAPRFRRAGAGASSQHAASNGGAGTFFGPSAAAAAAARCGCCPLPTWAGRSSGGGAGGAAASSDGGPLSWSGQSALEMLNKLLALGIEPPPSQGGGSGGPAAVAGEEEERAPFSRRSRKRMPLHFGRKPEDEDEEEEEEEEVGDAQQGGQDGNAKSKQTSGQKGVGAERAVAEDPKVAADTRSEGAADGVARLVL